MEDRILYFNEEKHKYTDEFSNPYISTTTLIGQYGNEFEAIKMANRCANAGKHGNPKYIGKTAEQLIKEWDINRDTACDKGSRKHDYLENIVKDATCYKHVFGTRFINDKLYTIKDIMQDKSIGRVDLEYFATCGLNTKYPKIYELLRTFASSGYSLYAEIGVYNSEFLISGMIDILAVKGIDFVIIDWKTNRAPIHFEAGYYEKDRYGNLTTFKESNKVFKTPLRHIPDSVGEHYCLQLSTYDYLAEGFGLVCKGNILCHIKPVSGLIDETVEEVKFLPIAYRKDDIHRLFNHYQLSKSRTREYQYLMKY
jgi:hypothetical protein